jgi:hypothetical protein
MIKEAKDELVWSKNAVISEYCPKLGYIVLKEEEGLQDQEWWYKLVWKFKCPSKAKIFMWLVLRHKVPTWDYMQIKSWHELGRCPLC